MKSFGSRFKIVPDITHLRQRTKNWPFELINVVRKAIRALNKFGFWFAYHFKLNFTDNFVVEPDINQNIVSSFPEPIFDSNNFHFLGIWIADVNYIFEEGDNLFLFWRAFASNKITYLKGYQVGRSRPVLPWFIDLFVEKFLWNC